MLFVDGENFAKRGAAVLEAAQVEPVEGRYWRKDVFLWLPRYLWGSSERLTSLASADLIRGYYYTSTPGDESARTVVRDQLRNVGFDGAVFHQPPRNSGRSSKGVDIALTTELLGHAHLGNFDIAVLAAGDGDYVPLIEAVKRLGKRVYLLGFEDGLSPALPRVADWYSDPSEALIESWKKALVMHKNGNLPELSQP
jgi:uncharacterized LabA/DUF88 family protein